jgi:hypothetical protein
MGTGRRYIARLKNASLGELCYRGRQLLVARYWRVSGRVERLTASVPLLSRTAVDRLFMPDLRWEHGCPSPTALLAEVAADPLAGCPLTKQAVQRYQTKILTDPGAISLPVDIRLLWEPARLQQVTRLVAGLRQADSVDVAGLLRESARSLVLRWLEDNPFPRGLHHLSVMECGLRIPVLFYTLKACRPNDVEFAVIARAIWCNAWLIRHRLSLYASLGNHTIAECVGLVFAGALYRDTGEGQTWLATALTLLRQELFHQVLADGGPVEQSLDYHRFVLDLYWLTIDFLAGNALADCRDMLPRLMAGEQFLTAFTSQVGTMPRIGDSDDGRAVAPGLAPKRPELPVPAAGVTRFPDAGYTLFHCQSGMVLTFDHGPLGMPPLCNHGHADALSVTCTIAGIPFLVDPGTYGYNGDPAARAWFKGTAAHNTITIDGCDQAVQETGFIWSSPYRCGVISHGERDGMYRLEAIHDGYARLPEPVRHKRSVWQIGDGQFLLRDTFWGDGVHTFESHLHLHPEVLVRQEGDWFLLECAGRELAVQMRAGSEPSRVLADATLVAGWYSPVYGSRLPSEVLRSRCTGSTDAVVFVTFICVGKPLAVGRQERLLCSMLHAD